MLRELGREVMTSPNEEPAEMITICDAGDGAETWMSPMPSTLTEYRIRSTSPVLSVKRVSFVKKNGFSP
jgi:hypothetical protein